MKTPSLLLTALLLGGTNTWLAAQPVSNASPYSAIYVFGDSRSNTTGSPYWRGRWSNGPMWAEILSTNWGLSYIQTNNYSRYFNTGTTDDVVGNQVPAFKGSSNASTALFVLWAGCNDIGWHVLDDNAALVPRALTNVAGWSNLIVRMTRNISNSVVRLHGKGARTVMVADLDEVQRLPVYPRLNETQAAQLKEQINAYNRALERTLTALDLSIQNLRLLRLNAHDRWNEFLDQAVNSGFTRVDMGALFDTALKDKSFTGPGKDYVFWDQSHPTTRTHGVMAAWIGEIATQSRTESLRLVARGDAFDLGLTRLKPGRKYTVETSHNLLDWVAHESFTAAEGTNTVTIAPSPDGPAMRLFRLAW